MNKTERIDRAWLRAALVFGMTMSKDPERRVGACVVSHDNMLVSFGYNGFPRGVADGPGQWADKEMKNALVKHAEENAVSKAPFDTNRGTCYVTLKPCHKCLGTLINAGITRVVWLYDSQPWKYENLEAFKVVLIKVLPMEYPITDVENEIINSLLTERDQ